MSTQEVSKIVNVVSFKVDQNSYSQAIKKIKQVAGAFSAATTTYNKSMAAGKQIAGSQAKAQDKLIRAEIKANKTRRDTLKADQIRYKDQIKNNSEFHKGLQRVNNEFLRGNLSFKERSAQIGQLNKQYRALNNNAGKHNSIIKGFGSRIASGAVGMAAGGTALLGASSYAATRGFDRVKAEGQSYESLVISLRNTFGNETVAVSNIIRQIATEGGRDLLETGQQLVNYVSIVKSLGIDTNAAIEMFKKQTNMTASYGMSKDAVAGFQYGLMQTMASNTLEDFKQAMDWSPQIKADLLKFVKDTMGLSQKDFMGNLTNGRYNFKDIWLKFVEASAPRYAQMAQGYKQSSMAQDSRAANAISIALYRVFESSGFKTAMQYGSQMVERFGAFLETNANNIGLVFGNLYKIAGELSDGALQELSTWLKSLTSDDIKKYFGDLKQGLMDLAFIIKSVANFIRGIIPNNNTGVTDAQRQTQEWKDLYNNSKHVSPIKAQAEADARYLALKQQQLSFTPPSLENALVLRSSQNTSQISNLAGKLSLDIEANVKQSGMTEFFDFRYNEKQTQQFNILANGY